MNLLKKIYLKTLDRESYNNYYYQLGIEQKRNNFKNNNYQEYIDQIFENIEKYEEINFLHSGHIGDLIYSLPVIKKLSETKTCNLYINLNKEHHLDMYSNTHIAGKVFINKKIYDKLLPLLKNQKYLNKVDVFENQKIHVNFDLWRDVFQNITFPSERLYFHLTGVQTDLSQKYLSAHDVDGFKDKITMVRTLRWNNFHINYDALRDVDNIVFLGLKNEYDNLKTLIPKLNFHEVKDFLEMASIINSSAFFIGNQTFPYSLAEGLKIPRLLEIYPEFAVVHPKGENAKGFYFKNEFEKYYKEYSEAFL